MSSDLCKFVRTTAILFKHFSVADPIKHMPSLGVSSLRLGPLTAALFYRVRRAGATHVALSFPKIASGDELRPRNDAWRSCMGSELRIPNAAAQTRIVSGGPFGRAKESLSRHLKYMAGARILEFESYMPSHAVGCPAWTHR